MSILNKWKIILALSFLCPLFFTDYCVAAPITRSSRVQVETTTKTLSANNTTASVNLFKITGDVLIHKLYGVVTTTIGSNHTAAHWRLEDGTNTPAITAATGTAISSAGVGSMLIKEALAATALTLDNSSATVIEESATLGADLAPFEVVQKLATNTFIVYRYTTTNTPTTGAIQFFCEWEPLSAGSSVVAQ
jgi:hypothetical protein